MKIHTFIFINHKYVLHINYYNVIILKKNFGDIYDL